MYIHYNDRELMVTEDSMELPVLQENREMLDHQERLEHVEHQDHEYVVSSLSSLKETEIESCVLCEHAGTSRRARPSRRNWTTR